MQKRKEQRIWKENIATQFAKRAQNGLEN